MIRKGRKSNPRYTDEYKDFRRCVLRRDKYRCQMPGCAKRSRLQVHHIIRFADAHSGRLNPSNGITICQSCHESIKDKESHYAKMFFDIVERNNEDN